MDRLRVFWQRLREAVSAIPPTDRCLILFLAVLLAQSAYSLFARSGSAGGGSIDVVVRTASAAIFGYFLSAKRRPSQTGQGEPDCLHLAAVFAVGMFCLLTLLALRNLSHWDPAEGGADSLTATAAQFRDFVLGCVGFLIGMPSGRDGPSEKQ